MAIVGIHRGWPIGKGGFGSSREPKNSGDRVVTSRLLRIVSYTHARPIERDAVSSSFLALSPENDLVSKTNEENVQFNFYTNVPFSTFPRKNFETFSKLNSSIFAGI